MKIQRILCLLLCLFLLIPAPMAALAEESAPLSAGEAQTLLDAVTKHLSIYARYEEVSEKTLLHAAIEKLLLENPALYQSALKGMLESVDQYSEYYDAEESKALLTSVSGEVVGIGVTIDFSMPEAGIIASVIPDTPAERAGLQVGDVILRADGVDLRNAKSEIILSHIRGEEGTEVFLEVERGGAVLGFTMVREKVIGTSITTEVHTEGSNRLMYICIHSFVSNTAEKFREALDDARSRGITNLVLDLRNNGGGLLDQAILMAQNFVPKGKLVTTQDFKIDMFSIPYYGTAKKEPEFEIAILTNGYTASASEVLSAALKENELATLIGTTTYGKGTVQSLSELADGGLIKYTSAFYLTPNGNNINGVGIDPDVYVENELLSLNKKDYDDFDYTRTYQVGDTGKDVRIAKEILTTYGLYAGEINETFDKELYYAIYSFQSQAGLFPYGCMDLTTQINLRNYLDIIKIEQDNQMEAAFHHFNMTYLEK